MLDILNDLLSGIPLVGGFFDYFLGLLKVVFDYSATSAADVPFLGDIFAFLKDFI